MKGYMYILLCSNGQYYTGSTNDIEKRIFQHQNGEGSNFTRRYRPVKLVYFEEFDRLDDAFFREKQVQGWSRKKKEALIKMQYDKLPELSKSYDHVTSTGSVTGTTGSVTGNDSVTINQKKQNIEV
ncbi:MAG: GIY-YIG nuclease family protein [Smithella sp.]